MSTVTPTATMEVPTAMSDRWASTQDSSDKALENRLRRVAARQGLILAKNRRRDKRATDYGVWYLRTKEGALVLDTHDLGKVAERLGEPIGGQRVRPANG